MCPAFRSASELEDREIATYGAELADAARNDVLRILAPA